MIPLRQVVSGFETEFEDEIIMRRDRKRTITVFADPIEGPATVLFERVRPQIEAISSCHRATRSSGAASTRTRQRPGRPRRRAFRLFVLVMVLVTIALFNSLRSRRSSGCACRWRSSA